MIKKFAKEIKRLGGRAYFVGGVIRDELLNVKSNDIDVVVLGCEFADVKRIADSLGEAKLVGNNFPVITVGNFDIALGRRETKTGESYTDFELSYDSSVTLEEDAARRDLTINAIYKDILSGKLTDPFGGVGDIDRRVMKHTSDKFTESNERPLRVAQLHARFPEFRIDDKTLALCASMVSQFELIPNSQVLRQFTKLLMKGVEPSVGLRDMKRMGYLKVFPTLNDLVGVEQNPLHHPEGDVFEHTCQVIDAMTCLTIGFDDDRKFALMLSALLHDTGKPATTIKTDEAITAHGHCKHTKPAKDFLASIHAPNQVADTVIALTKEHMILSGGSITRRGVRRLARRMEGVATISDLSLLIKADRAGRGRHGSPGFYKCEDLEELISLSEGIGVAREPTKGILMGRHLIELGLKPSPLFGEILSEALVAQDNEMFNDLDGAIAFAVDAIKHRSNND